MAAATRKGHSIIFTALTDTYAGQIVSVQGISLRGAGLTPGQDIQLLDDGGDVVADYITEAATDNADLWGGRQPQFYQGLKLASAVAGAVAGTWVLTVFTE